MEAALWKQRQRFQAAGDFPARSEAVWEMIIVCYTVKGHEIKISRKEKTITRATVEVALRKALALKVVDGPKKLGVFGASYLYPLFLYFGIITKKE